MKQMMRIFVLWQFFLLTFTGQIHSQIATSAPIGDGPQSPIPLQNLRNHPSLECGKTPFFPGFFMQSNYAAQGEWPWMVAITMANRKGRQSGWCTGFMIDTRHVLSAAHCFRKRDPKLYMARIGNVDQTQADEYSVTRIVIPSGYTVGRFYDDIALLTLSRAVDTPGFTPICLPWDQYFVDITGKGASVAGWEGAGIDGIRLKNLNGFPIVGNEECGRTFSRILESRFKDLFPRGITSGLMCAGFLDEEGNDNCVDYSGAPLMHLHKDRWFSVGVSSFGFCGGKQWHPAGYTRVTEYLDWINRNLND